MQKSQQDNITITNLSLNFGTTEVLKNINLEIKSGEFFSFLGPSGSGKSTLLRSISGFGPTPNGSIKIGNKEIINIPAWKRNIGMVFQSYALWPHMSAYENVAFGLKERKVAKSKIKVLVDEALDLVALKHLANRYPAQLSGGQQQRIALARTIVVKPRVLLLDEPLSNLDANLRVQMRRDILALQRKLGLTTVFVTHDQSEANTISDRMAVLNDGVIQQVGSPIELYDTPKNHFVASFLGEANMIQGCIKNKTFVSNDNLRWQIDTTKDGNVDLMIRPQSIVLSEIIPKSNKNSYTLSGKISYSEFLGESVRYFIDVNEHKILVDEAHQKGELIRANNKTVYLTINKDQVLII